MTVVPLERSLALGRLELFASAPDDPRARRPIDGIRAAVALTVLIVAAVLAELGGNLDGASSNVLVQFPPVLRVLWLVAFWLALAWAVALVGFAAFGNRQVLAIEIVGGGALALGVCVIVARIVSDDVGTLLGGVLDTDGPPTFPPVALAATSAAVSTATPYLTLPFRRFGRYLVGAQMVGAVFLGISFGSGAIAALAAGWLAGSILHLVVGSPGGLPTVGRVDAALRQLGVHLDDLATLRMRRDGVTLLAGRDRAGTVHVKVYGRDAWDSELLAGAWLNLWYRDSRHSTRLGRSEMVEHEGFMTFLAARAGARVPEVVTAGRAENGDALIVMRPTGTSLQSDDISLTESQVRSLWGELATLHAGGIAHRRIDLDRIVRHGDDTAAFGDLSSSSVQADEVDLRTDRAQLLSLTLLTSGEQVAVAAARSALGDDTVADVLPYLQEAALPPVVRAALDRRDVDLDDVRDRLTDALGAPKPELVRLRRVTWGSLLNMALVTIAAYTIIGMLGGIDFEQFGEALADAQWWWLALALFVGQTPRVAAAFSTIGSSRQPLPLGPTCALQFATCYINLTVPSSAGRIALTTRFFQRFGVSAAAALSAGFIDTAAQTIIQISIFLLVFLASDIDLELSLDPDQLSGLATIATIAIAALVVCVLIVALVPAVRRRLVAPLRQVRQALQVVRMPRKLLQLLGGNLGSEILFALTLAICARAFGYDLALSTFILINSVVSLFSSVIPVPGGIGVTEAGLTMGLTAAGVDADTAFAIALSHRFITFYLPPVWGLMSYKWLIRHRFL